MLRKLIETHPECVAVGYTAADVRDITMRSQMNVRFNKAREAIDKRTTVIFCDKLDRGILSIENRKSLKAVVVMHPGDMTGLDPPSNDIPVFFLGQDKTVVWQKGVQIEINPVDSRVDAGWSRMIEFASILCNNDRIPNWGIFQVFISEEESSDEFVYALLLQKWMRTEEEEPKLRFKKTRIVLKIIGKQDTPGSPSMLFLPWKIKYPLCKIMATTDIITRGTDRVYYLDTIDADILPAKVGAIEDRVKSTLETLKVAVKPASALSESETDRFAPTATVLNLARNPLLEEGVHVSDAYYVIDCDAGRVLSDWKAPFIEQKTIKLVDHIRKVDDPLLVEPTTVGKFIWPRRFLAANFWARILAGKEEIDCTDSELEYIDRTKKWMDIEKPRLRSTRLDVVRGVRIPATDDIPGEKIDLPPPLDFVVEDKRVLVFPVACLGPYTSEIDYSYSTKKETSKERDIEKTSGWFDGIGDLISNFYKQGQEEVERQEKIAEEIEKQKQKQYEDNYLEKTKEEREEREREKEKERKAEEARLETDRLEKEALKKAASEEERRKIIEKSKAYADIEKLVKENGYLRIELNPSKKIDSASFTYTDDRLFALGKRYSAVFIVVPKDKVISDDQKSTAGFVIDKYMKARTDYAAFDPVTPLEAREIFARIYQTWDAVVLGERLLDEAETTWTGLEYSADRVPQDVVIDPWVARCIMHRMDIAVYNTFYRDRVGVFEFRFNPAAREDRRPKLEDAPSLSAVTTPWDPRDEHRLSDFSTVPLLILDRLVNGDWTAHDTVFAAADAYRVRLQAVAWNLPMVEGMKAGFAGKMLRILLPSKQTADEYAALVGRRATSGGVMRVTERTEKKCHVAVAIEEKIIVPVGIYYK